MSLEDCADFETEFSNSTCLDSSTLRKLCRKYESQIPHNCRKDVWRYLLLGMPQQKTVEPLVDIDAETDIALQRKDTRWSEDAQDLECAIRAVSFNLENQRVVTVDVERTRPGLEQFKLPETQDTLLRVLTYYCKERAIGYKQGMHEVLAPFVALSHPAMAITDIYRCYGKFIDKFLPYAFNRDEEFISLQICFRLFRLLLLYHHPQLCKFLDQYQLQPELYATPWFLTLFASTLELPVLYQIWDFYLSLNDPAIHHFVVLALVIENAEVILAENEANLPEKMCKLALGTKTAAQVRPLLNRAQSLLLNTPKSFRKILSSSLYSHLKQEQLQLVHDTLQKSSCIPVAAEEVISYILHKNPYGYLDEYQDASIDATETCSPAREDLTSAAVNTSSSSVTDNATHNRHEEARIARDAMGHRQYIIMDCRSKESFNALHLAPALNLDPGLLSHPESMCDKLHELSPLKGFGHFCLVGEGNKGTRSKKKTNGADLSGEAMGLLRKDWRSSNDRSERSNTHTFLAREGSPDPINRGIGAWTDSLMRALSRDSSMDENLSSGDASTEQSEEDVNVSKFVLMLLQHNYQYVSHVRGDMVACLQALKTCSEEQQQEDGGSPSPSGNRNNGANQVHTGISSNNTANILIGTDVDEKKKVEPSPTGGRSIFRWSTKERDDNSVKSKAAERHRALSADHPSAQSFVEENMKDAHTQPRLRNPASGFGVLLKKLGDGEKDSSTGRRIPSAVKLANAEHLILSDWLGENASAVDGKLPQTFEAIRITDDTTVTSSMADTSNSLDACLLAVSDKYFVQFLKLGDGGQVFIEEQRVLDKLERITGRKRNRDMIILHFRKSESGDQGTEALKYVMKEQQACLQTIREKRGYGRSTSQSPSKLSTTHTNIESATSGDNQNATTESSPGDLCAASGGRRQLQSRQSCESEESFAFKEGII